MKRAWIALALTSALWAQPQNPYPPDSALRFLPLGEVVQHTKESGLEPASPIQVLEFRPVPFQSLGIAPQKVTPVRQRTWEMPPFATIGPPRPGAEPAPAEEQTPPVFSEVGSTLEGPSPYLRPKGGARKFLARFDDYQIPEPISRVCYASNNAGICQLSLYGGTTSFEAEEAYVALSATLDKRETLHGFGKESLWGTYREKTDKPKVQSETRFESIPVSGKARPDLVDPGLNQARKAPAFKEISTQPHQKGRLDLSRLPPPRPPQAPRAPRSYLVLLAYYPDKAVTMELLIDQRLGTLQSLLDLALGVRTRLRAFL